MSGARFAAGVAGLVLIGIGWAIVNAITDLPARWRRHRESRRYPLAVIDGGR